MRRPALFFSFLKELVNSALHFSFIYTRKRKENEFSSGILESELLRATPRLSGSDQTWPITRHLAGFLAVAPRLRLRFPRLSQNHPTGKWRQQEKTKRLWWKKKEKKRKREKILFPFNSSFAESAVQKSAVRAESPHTPTVNGYKPPRPDNKLCIWIRRLVLIELESERFFLNTPTQRLYEFHYSSSIPYRRLLSRKSHTARFPLSFLPTSFFGSLIRERMLFRGINPLQCAFFFLSLFNPNGGRSWFCLSPKTSREYFMTDNFPAGCKCKSITLL